jgi:hypothetical protein
MDFKVGQEVLVDFRYHKRISKIKKITKTGLISVEGEDGFFSANGRKRGTDIFTSCWIKHMTPETKEMIEKEILVRQLSSDRLRWEDLTIDKLREIKKIIENTEKHEPT